MSLSLYGVRDRRLWMAPCTGICHSRYQQDINQQVIKIQGEGLGSAKSSRKFYELILAGCLSAFLHSCLLIYVGRCCIRKARYGRLFRRM